MAGTKRQRSPSPSNIYSNKSRAKPSESRIDPIYGQRSALPGLDDDIGDDDSLNYDEDGADALNYLRSVRHEAEGLPTVMYAPTSTKSTNAAGDYDRSIYESGVGDFRGYYEDGAFYAAVTPDVGDEDEIQIEGDEGKDPQLAYFDSILTRYQSLREQLQEVPPTELVQQLDADHPIHLGKLDTKNSRWWRWKMRTVDPVPVQLAMMNKGTVLKLLRLLMGGALLKSGGEVNLRVSRWAWGLLARLPERGELTSEEVGVIRELGKKAVLVGVGLKEESRAWEEGLEEVEKGFEDEEEMLVKGETNSEEGNEVVESGEQSRIDTAQSFTAAEEETGITDPSELEAIKARMLASLTESKEPETEPKELDTESKELETEVTQTSSETPPEVQTPKWNTRATIDMIITVTGEIYGQRDLLEFRETWGA